ncbi:MAG: ParB/RepB/Spo0J family partition protein [Candidatus Andersenbacteria bacterium]
MAFGLGRGLESLIPTKASKPSSRPAPLPARTAPAATTEVAIVDLVANPRQPRKTFPLPELETLAASIKTHGILEPLVVSPGATTGQFVLVAGERRLRAAELAGLAKVPVVVRDTDDREKLELALIENIQRQDLNPLEEARALKQLLEDFKLNHNEVAARVGRSRPAVSNILRLLELAPEAQRALLAGRISAGHARALLACSGHAQQVELLQVTEQQRLSVRDVERLAAQAVRGSQPSRRARGADDASAGDPAAEAAARKLSRQLGTRVQVITTGQAGRIVVEYSDAAERERIVDTMLGQGQRSSKRGAFSV